MSDPKRPKTSDLSLALFVGVAAAGAAALVFFAHSEPWALRGDNRMIHFPMTEAAYRSWLGGSLPEWSDQLWTGFPLLADPVSAALYLPHLLPFLVTPAPHLRAFDLATALHAGLLAAGTFLLLRALSAGRLASLFGAALALVGPQFHFYASFFLPSFVALSWWPWALLAAERLTQPGRSVPAYLVLGSGALAAQALGGYPELALYCGLFAGAWIVTRRSSVPLGARVARTALLGIGAGMLAAPQILSTVFELQDTSRALRPELRSVFAARLDHPLGFLDPFAPAPLGAPEFVGAAALALAAVAIFGRARRGVFLAGAACVGFVLALGNGTPVYAIVTSVPPLSLFRGPLKFMIVADFALIWLSALGLQVLLERARGRGTIRLWAAVLLALMAYGERAVCIGMWHARHPHADAEPLSTILEPVRGALRRAVHSDAAASPPRVYVRGSNYALGNLGMLYGIATLNSGPTTFLAPRHRRLVRPPLREEHLDLFGVEYVYRRRPCPPEPPRTRLIVVFDEPGACVLRNPHASPRTEYIRSARAVTSPARMESLVRSSPEGPIPVLAPADEVARRVRPDPPKGGGSLWSQRPGRIEISLSASRDALLLVRESWKAGWRAAVDGEPVPVYRAAGLFFAVPVPEGRHSLSLRFRQPGLRVGLAAAGAWIAAAALALLRGRRSAAPPQHGAGP